ncbi:PilN domain-containing protein [Telmatospirillum sp.]|uniref:PilN domain-containing protein n=1 Tax=Telmatospirillum sp. TaxID=2079197 RepID=UPI0028467B36|nr:PilN domain-containing protein [Telmatospirillum sp.]MDR3436838.1 PilN domain-containing protein [Telmatospirillum sp.]
MRPSALELCIRRGGQLSRRGQFPCDADGVRRLAQLLSAEGASGDLLLSLPSGVLLEKALSLPAAVERDLDRVLRYEMDEETPFSPDEVYWDWTVDSRDRVLRKIGVSLSLLPQSAVDGLLGLLRGHGIVPNGISVSRADGAVVLLPLAHAGKEGALPLLRQPRILWGGCLALVLLAVALPFLLQSLVFADLDARIAASRGAAAEAQALQARLDGTAGGGDVILAERRRLAEPLAVLAVLTDALPDDTFLSDLSLKGRRLSVVGQSTSATRLISILANNGLFHDPSFAAPVTRLGTEANALEVFSIVTEVRGAP